MSKKIITIRFKNIHQLWEYARKIKAVDFEIIAADMVLTCDCSNLDPELLSLHQAEIIEGYHRHSNQQPINRN